MDWKMVEYDAIVVGSGATGGMAAKCLTDGGANVLVLEAGPELPPGSRGETEKSRQEFEAMKARQPIQSRSLLYNQRNCHLFIDDLDNPYSSDCATTFNWIRSRQAGGRTLIWSRFALRMSEEDLASRALALGGLFSSRINMNLREEHGYTYGAGSVFSYRRLPGPFYVATGVRTDVTGPAVSEIFKEVTRMAETPLTSEELGLAKDSLVRSLPGAFETSGQMVSNLSNIYVYDLGLDYFSRYPERMSAVTPEMAREVAKKYLDPSKMLVIAVGDRATIAPELQRLNLGRTEIRDADGKVIR